MKRIVLIGNKFVEIGNELTEEEKSKSKRKRNRQNKKNREALILAYPGIDVNRTVRQLNRLVLNLKTTGYPGKKFQQKGVKK